MVIGAYIVTSYFIFVEKNPDKNKEDIYESLEEIIKTVIHQLPPEIDEIDKDLGEKIVTSNYQDKNETTFDFELSGLLDEKSQNFIKKYDTVMTQIFNVDNEI